MRLVYTEGPNEGKEVKVGDRVELKGITYQVNFVRPPTSPASSGKVSVMVLGLSGVEREFYVSVIGAKWIEREDQNG